jgi:hypothetical protein
MGKLRDLGFTEWLLLGGATLVGLFLILVVTLYVRNARTVGAKGANAYDDFDKRNDDRMVKVVDSKAENDKYMAERQYNEALAQQEAERRAATEREREQAAREREQQEAILNEREKELKEEKGAKAGNIFADAGEVEQPFGAAHQESSTTSGADFFSDFDAQNPQGTDFGASKLFDPNTKDAPTENFGFAPEVQGEFEGAMSKKDIRRMEREKREQEEAEARAKREQERNARKNGAAATPNLFDENFVPETTDAGDFFSAFGAEPVASGVNEKAMNTTAPANFDFFGEDATPTEPVGVARENVVAMPANGVFEMPAAPAFEADATMPVQTYAEMEIARLKEEEAAHAREIKEMNRKFQEDMKNLQAQLANEQKNSGGDIVETGLEKQMATVAAEHEQYLQDQMGEKERIEQEKKFQETEKKQMEEEARQIERARKIEEAREDKIARDMAKHDDDIRKITDKYQSEIDALQDKLAGERTVGGNARRADEIERQIATATGEFARVMEQYQSKMRQDQDKYDKERHNFESQEQARRDGERAERERRDMEREHYYQERERQIRDEARRREEDRERQFRDETHRREDDARRITEQHQTEVRALQDQLVKERTNPTRNTATERELEDQIRTLKAEYAKSVDQIRGEQKMEQDRLEQMRRDNERRETERQDRERAERERRDTERERYYQERERRLRDDQERHNEEARRRESERERQFQELSARREEEIRRISDKYNADIRLMQDRLAGEHGTTVERGVSARESELLRKIDEQRAELDAIIAEKEAEQERILADERRARIRAKRQREQDERKAEMARQQEMFNQAIAQMQAQHTNTLATMQMEMEELRNRLGNVGDKKVAAELKTEEKVKEQEIKRELHEFEVLRAELERTTKDLLERQRDEMREIMEKNVAFDESVKMNREVAESANRELFAKMSEEIDQLRGQIEKQVVVGAGDAVATNADEISNIGVVMQQLAEERKHSREEAARLKQELDDERIENQKQLGLQFEALKNAFEEQKQAEYEDALKFLNDKVAEETVAAEQIKLERAERDALIENLKREKAQYEDELRRQYNELKRETEERAAAAIRQSEETERALKEQYDAYKANLTSETREIGEKNKQLRDQLEKAQKAIKTASGAQSIDIEAERAKIAEQLRGEFEQNERLLSEKYMQLRTELQRESRQLADKSEEIKQEKDEIRRQKDELAKQNVAANKEFETEQKRLADELKAESARVERELKDEKERLERENARLRASAGTATVQTVIDVEEVERLKSKLQREYEENEKALKDRYYAMQEEAKRNEMAIEARKAELQKKEEFISTEEKRIQRESVEVHTMITERSYTTEERDRILADYRAKIIELQNRLKVNDKAIRENNKEFVPLRRIKDTLERDLKLLRKREAIVAKQQVLVYGVNNITSLDPERVKKLEQDVKQLTGLQQSVANCEEILNKNKDRYPTLHSLDKVLKQQNSQLLSDIDEINQTIKFFESYTPNKK